MATDEGGKAVSKVVLSERMTSKIREFASKHSDGIEDADKLQNVLEELLHKIISYRRTGKKFEGLRNTDMVEVAVVPVMEGLSVRIKVSGDELQELFKREIPQSEVEKCFLKLLGFHEPSGDAAISETKECNVGIGLKRVLLAFFVACVETR